MPKISNEGSSNPLQCPTCREYRYLVFREAKFRAPVNRAVTLTVPLYECRVCKKADPFKPWKDIASDAKMLLTEKVQDNEAHAFSHGFENKRFNAYNDLRFKYDTQDYYFIPGLSRPWDDGYLTPVFFNIDLLLHYNNHPNYRVKLPSFSTVDIYAKNGEALIDHGFGINRNGNLFAWLGDLHKVLSLTKNKEHLHRFRASNIDSDHEVVSDFYFQQIEAQFTESDT